jgi:hypothetical protein
MPVWLNAQYTGTGSVTQGKGITTQPSFFSCTGGRVTSLGSIASSDNKTWAVPAAVNFSNSSFPLAGDLYNSCNTKTYLNAADALKAFNTADIVNIDADGELITAYVFADNYFEMYVNGKPVGKDKVPFTQFNSSLMRFRVKQPFVVAILAVDWEEAMGLGTEANGPAAYHAGDGGLVAVFTDSTGKIISVTDKQWKAQTYYTAPIKDLRCPTETGNLRLSDRCSTADSSDGNLWYGLHWERPAGWEQPGFNDASWPYAYEYANSTIGVDNKPAYTRFTDIFDNAGTDAKFIWSSNVILDNEVLMRHTIGSSTGVLKPGIGNRFNVWPNPSSGKIYINLQGGLTPERLHYTVFNSSGKFAGKFDCTRDIVDLGALPQGFYILNIATDNGFSENHKIHLLYHE